MSGGRPLLALHAALLAACASVPPAASPGAPGPVADVVATADTSLEGAFRWTAVDGRPAPADYPSGSGAMLVDGSLELRDVPAARRDGTGRFDLRFTLRPPADTARPTGEGGRFRIAGDSLLFTPDGRESRPPVRFRYAWRPDGVLALTDAQGHAWTYVRR